MSVSRLDKLYRSILLTKFFTKGWGKPENLYKIFEFRKLISDRNKCYQLVPKDYPVTIINNKTWNGYRILDGKFRSPLVAYMPDIVPAEVAECYFQIILPKNWNCQHFRPMCIHFAGTGDHYFWRRRNVMAKPLLKSNIGAILLENPFYGLRKPKDQVRSSLHYVSDIFVMGGCLILESLVLLHWCEKMGFGPLGVSGLSMGGHMASLAATNWPKPLVLVPCLSWSTASSVFTEGVMSDAINWDLLQNQFFSDSRFYDILSKSCIIVDDPFESMLSSLPDLVNENYNPEILSSSKALTPYEVVSLLKDTISHYKQYSCNKNPEKSLKTLPSFLQINLANLLRNGQSLLFKQLKFSRMKKQDLEAVWFMRGVMDECTHLKNFSVPYDTSLVIAISAKSDAYVPRKGCSNLQDLWPGSTVRYIDSGHVGAYLWHRKVFRDAILESFERAKHKCSPPSPVKI